MKQIIFKYTFFYEKPDILFKKMLEGTSTIKHYQIVFTFHFFRRYSEIQKNLVP